MMWYSVQRTLSESLGDLNPVAVVTGASRGLGNSLGHAFRERGFTAVGAARSKSPCAGSALEHYSSLDVGDEQAVQSFADQVVDRFGRIDVWVNNAAVVDIFGVADGSSERWSQLISVNVLGVVHGCQAFARHVRSRPGPGVLVNLTAGSAKGARRGWGGYAATKAAVERITEAVAAEEQPAGLTAFSFSPGAMDTDMQRSLCDLPSDVFPDVHLFRERAGRGEIPSPGSVAGKLVEQATEKLRADSGRVPL
ncbi:SDR family oxidoreductase [Streptomyces sp. IBSBF 2435]|uniref:SDR family oxidoreductase n=1 Tax=Streptomyces sp. IBSBF 2435 TaxID=2903531 RepID=UPI002FDBCA36